MGITTREIKILRLFGKGFSNMQIAKELQIGQQGLKSTITGLFKKLQVQDRTHAVVTAIRDQCIALDDIGNEVLTAEEFDRRPHCPSQIARNAASQLEEGRQVSTSGANRCIT
jgi:DNA-binding CsgD family transcriptional regulator